MAEEQKKQETPKPEAAAANSAPAAAEVAVESSAETKRRKKKSRKHSLLEANVHVCASYNNTIITVTEPNGNVVCWSSSGACGFKGTRKATPYAASVAAETAMNKAKILGVERVHISVKGIGAGRDQALRAINASGVTIESIKDKTVTSHNGCRARKARRI